jgi:hypothetical protein
MTSKTGKEAVRDEAGRMAEDVVVYGDMRNEGHKLTGCHDDICAVTLDAVLVYWRG